MLKILPPPEFDPGTVQHVASRYTDYNTWPTVNVCDIPKILPPQVSHPNATPVLHVNCHSLVASNVADNIFPGFNFLGAMKALRQMFQHFLQIPLLFSPWGKAHVIHYAV